MRRLGVAAVLLVVLGVAEVAVFIVVAEAIGLAWTLLAALGTSALGGWLLRREGSRGWRRFRDAVAEGRPPGHEGVDGAVGLLGALLLAVPGFVTDAAGLLLLAPPVRGLARSGVRRATETRISPAAAGQVFGPRLVRVKRRRAAPRSQPPPGEQPPRSEPPAGPQQAIEGEVIDSPPDA